MKISVFSEGCRPLPISQQLSLSPMPDPALSASVLTGLIQSGSSQHQQSAFFGIWEGKGMMDRRNGRELDYQKDTRLDKEK